MSNTKTVQCFYHNDPDCSKEFHTVLKNHASVTFCKMCKSLGKENPDGRTKKQANQKRCETFKKKYGKNVSNASHIPDNVKKRISTNIERYGGVGFGSKELAIKARNNIMDKYGVDNIMKTENGKLFFCGDKNPMKRSEISLKVSKSLKGKTSKLKGRSYHDIHGNIKSKLLKDQKKKILIKQFLKRFKQEQEYLNLIFVDNIEYEGAYIQYSFECSKCNLVFKKDWNSIQQGYLCPSCFPRNIGVSKGEKELLEFVRSICDHEIVENSRKIIPPKEIDIYIPSKNIAIEFNGLYWHSEEMCKEKDYHIKKTMECLSKGIRLIQIFEDEWIYKKDIVKGRLQRILNFKDFIKIYDRECIIKEIESSEKNNFLSEYHIQGEDRSSVKLGSFYKGELVSVMTFSKGSISKGSKPIEGVWELNRFCSKLNYQIPGMASKLLSHFKKNYIWKEIFSYADRRWSEGNVYEKLGFELSHITKPNYWYIKGSKRIHRFNLRKRPDEPKDIPEWVLREKEGLYRIWDCGNLKFTMAC